jgi:prepilin-type processing-associated H-X9-DG protein
VFATAREKARQTSCASNEKQLGLGFIQYAEDYDEMWPSGNQADGDALTGVGWAGQIYGYEKSTGVYACPDDPTTGGGTSVPVSYAFNVNLAGGGFETTGNLASLNAPSNTVLLVEVENVAVGAGSATLADGEVGNCSPDCSATVTGNQTTIAASVTEPADLNDQSAGVASSGVSGRGIFYATGFMGGVGQGGWYWIPSGTGVHTQGANYLGADGHVKWLRPNSVSPGFNATSATGTQTTVYNTGTYDAHTDNACATGELTNGADFTLTFSAI